jgi:hypothetical protein
MKAATARLSESTVGERWPVRQRWAFVVLSVALVLLGTLTQGWAFASAPLWSALVLVALVTAAGALATFAPLPGEGRLLHLGCGPCVPVDALAAVGGAWLALTSAHDGGTASLALALTGFALARRATAPQSCDRGC